MESCTFRGEGCREALQRRDALPTPHHISSFALTHTFALPFPAAITRVPLPEESCDCLWISAPIQTHSPQSMPLGPLAPAPGMRLVRMYHDPLSRAPLWGGAQVTLSGTSFHMAPLLGPFSSWPTCSSPTYFFLYLPNKSLSDKLFSLGLLWRNLSWDREVWNLTGF